MQQSLSGNVPPSPCSCCCSPASLCFSHKRGPRQHPSTFSVVHGFSSSRFWAWQLGAQESIAESSMQELRSWELGLSSLLVTLFLPRGSVPRPGSPHLPDRKFGLGNRLACLTSRALEWPDLITPAIYTVGTIGCACYAVLVQLLRGTRPQAAYNFSMITVPKHSFTSNPSTPQITDFLW